jgi:hypothetical protein
LRNAPGARRKEFYCVEADGRITMPAPDPPKRAALTPPGLRTAMQPFPRFGLAGEDGRAGSRAVNSANFKAPQL